MKFCILIACAVFVHTAFAATRYVATTGNDGGGGNDCSSQGSPCATLEHAADQANSGDVILLAPGVYTESDIDVETSVTFQGSGASTTIIQAAPVMGAVTNRVFDFKVGQTSMVNDVTVRHGFDSTNSIDGAGIRNKGTLTLSNTWVLANASGRNGGGVWNSDHLILQNSVIASNTCPFYGGGVYNKGLLEVGHLVVNNNAAVGNGGGIWNEGDATIHQAQIRNNTSGANGGGIRSSGMLWVDLSEITGNAATNLGGGGGIQVNGYLGLQDSTVSSNWTGAQGGGLWNDVNGTVEVSRCTFSFNRAAGGTGFGGGGIENDGVMNLLNSTVSHNTATNRGGGIRNNVFNPRTLLVQHCTVVSNGALKGGGVYNEQVTTTFLLGHTVVANNTDAGTQPDGFGPITSQGFNLVKDPTGISWNGGTPGHVHTLDPQLGPLQGNGGATHTHALQSTNSPAYNAGDLTFSPSPYSDQRGFVPRVEGGRVDIGAFELADGNDDNDNDELPDLWEIHNMLDPNDDSGTQGAGGNPDADPSNNEVEYTADTNPQDSNSFWQVTTFALTNSASLSYASSTGRVYSLQMTDDLSSGNWSNVTGQVSIPGSGGLDRLTGPNAFPHRNFRVAVDLP